MNLYSAQPCPPADLVKLLTQGQTVRSRPAVLRHPGKRPWRTWLAGFLARLAVRCYNAAVKLQARELRR